MKRPSMISASLGLFSCATVALAASSPPVTICSSTQCLQGTTDSLLGVTLSSPSLSSSILLLPDTYASSSSLPSLLLSALSSPLTTITLPPSSLLNASSGTSGSISLPLTISQGFPLLSFPSSNFTGTGVSYSLAEPNSTFATTNLNAASFMLSDGVWAVISQNTTNSRMILWESVTDLSEISSSSPFSRGAASTLVALQSSSCSTPCSSLGTCTTSGTCSCPPQFSGPSCETCAKGFFGPDCKPCPEDCLTCDDGPSGSGLCLSTTSAQPPSSCNCTFGTCSPFGSCTCNPGWTTPKDTSTNSTQCSTCADGFFDNGDGQCRACALGCEACSSGSGTCTSCKTGFVQDSSNPTQCIVPVSSTSCSDGTYNNGGTCSTCSSLCKTCSGPLSTDCIICGAGRSSLDGQCVTIGSNGVCSPPNVGTTNSTFIANNAKNECDTCPSACTSCQIPSFSVVSTIDQAQCTGCLPGYVLSQGQCVEKCPAGTFVDPSGDGLTCVACDPSCGTCAGSKTFCLSCAQPSSFALNGACVSSCPSSTFSSSGACLPCHPDCATCSGTGFDKCSTCPSDRPVLSSGGRCLMTCGKNEYYDSSSGGTGACKSCDSSCSTCTSSGPSSCLTCPSGKALRDGSCVDALCTGGNAIGIVTSLGGICLSSLVTVAPGVPIAVPSGTGSSVAPGATVPALQPSQRPSPQKPSIQLTWWQIALIVGGGAAILILGLLLWRRSARRARHNETLAFKEQKLDKTSGWRGWFGFGTSSNKKRKDPAREVERLREAESWRYEMDAIENGLARRRSSVLHSPRSDRFGVGGSWARSDIRARRAPSIASATSSLSSFTSPSSPREREEERERGTGVSRPLSGGTAWTAPSEYSQATAQPTGSAAVAAAKRYTPPPPVPNLNRSDSLAVPQPRQPIKDTSTARYSTIGNPNPLIDLSPHSTGITTVNSVTTGIDPHYPVLRNLPKTQPLVDVPIVSSTGTGQQGGAYWIAAVDRMPSTTPQRDRNPFRQY